VHAEDGRFCWLDLAAVDAAAAKRFYADAFGWRFADVRANGGVFTRCSDADGRDVASLYQLRRDDVERGAASHWTAYLAVADVAVAARRVAAAGGRVLVQPFAVEDVARIALVEDAVGAVFGVWQTQAQSPPLRSRRAP